MSEEESTSSGSRTIEENLWQVLNRLAEAPRDALGQAWIPGDEISEATNLTPPEINDAINLLLAQGLVEWRQTMGTAPFDFAQVTITSRGRYEIERTLAATTQEEGKIAPTLPPQPVGSPYGFTHEDWKTVTERKSNQHELRVVFGSPFKSSHFDVDQLRTNVGEMFQKAVEEYNQQASAIQVNLEFQVLAAGYGEHLFNEIARDIISADIAVFDTSDLNPNVMIEMGVALTWDVRVLPIKVEGCEKPPSDISGQTWADYRDSGSEWIDSNHHRKLIRMVERAVRKKGRV